MNISEELDKSITAFKASAGVALALRREALRVIPVVAFALQRAPYSSKALEILRDATRVVDAHSAARSATLDSLSRFVEDDLGHGADSRLPSYLLELVAQQSIQDWFDAVEKWQNDAAERDIVIAELDIPEAQLGGTDV